MVNLRDELEAIRLANGGLLTEEAILTAARAKKHPLHDRFTWNNTEAAKQWRLEEARSLIRSVYVTIERPKHGPITVRAYASLPTDRESGVGYRAIGDIMASRDQRKELLASALSELEAFKRRYGNLTELVPVFTAFESVKAKRTVIGQHSRTPSRRKTGTAARV